MQFIDVGTMVSPTVYARRSLCYLMCDQAAAALRDAMQAQIVYPDWPTAFHMQSVALAKLDMHQDAADMLKDAAELEVKRQKGGRRPWDWTFHLWIHSFFMIFQVRNFELLSQLQMYPKK